MKLARTLKISLQLIKSSHSLYKKVAAVGHNQIKKLPESIKRHPSSNIWGERRLHSVIKSPGTIWIVRFKENPLRGVPL
jgi:hypothetical protein